MNFKTTLLLIILLAIAGITFYFVQKQPVAQPEQTSAKNLLDINQDNVTEVTLTPAEGQAITLEHEGSDWSITKPIQAKADTFTASDLVSELCGLQSHAQVGADIDTGVDHPDYRVELTTKDGKTTMLAFGQKSAVGNNLYVRVNNDPKVDVVSGDVESYLNKSLSDYRDMNLVSVMSTKIDRVEMEWDGKRVTVARREGRWELPVEHWQGDSSQIEDLLSSLTSLRAAGFVEQPMSEAVYQFKNPQLIVHYWISPANSAATQPTTEPTEKTIVFGGYENLLKQDVFAKVDDTVARVATASMDNLKKTPLDLRDRDVLDIDPARVTGLEIHRHLPATTQPTSRPASGIDLVIDRNTKAQAATMPATKPATNPTTQSAPTWVFANKAETTAKVNEDNVSDVLAALHPLKAEKYLKKLPSTMPSDQFRLTVTAAGQKYTIYFSATPANDTNAIATYNGSIFEVPNTLIDHLKLDFGWQSK